MEGKAYFNLLRFKVRINIHLPDIAGRFGDELHPADNTVPVGLRVFGCPVIPLVHRVFQAVVDTKCQRVQTGCQLFCQNKAVRSGKAFIGCNRFAIHKDSCLPMTAFQRENNFSSFPLFGYHDFTLIPRLSAVFELAAQAIHMGHNIPDPLAPFIHRTGQLDCFRQFAQIQFRSGGLAESHRV